MNKSAIQTIAAQELARALELPLTSEQLDRLGKVFFVLSARMTSTAGTATFRGPSQGRVKLSLPIFTDPRNGDESNLRNTLRHELAHIAAPDGAGHGPVWKRIARSMGCTAERCHEMAVTRKTRRMFRFTCSCCSKELATIARAQMPSRIVQNRVSVCCRAGMRVEEVSN
tara:strand:+ start:16727 stop:17236 length:510 start_codon:yes stop_codon:yes gene_type:complete